MQVGFLLAGFSWSDAFLSAGVASTSLTLSGSYYYTVYGARRIPAPATPAPARRPIDVEPSAPHALRPA